MASSHTNLAARLAAVLAMRRLERRRRPVRTGQAHGPGQQHAGPLELHRHVGQLPLQALQLGQRTARR